MPHYAFYGLFIAAVKKNLIRKHSSSQRCSLYISITTICAMVPVVLLLSFSDRKPKESMVAHIKQFVNIFSCSKEHLHY